MPFELVFLESNERLTKTFTRKPDDTIDKSSYPSAYLFTSHHETIATLGDFEQHIKAHSADGHCLIKGVLDRPLINERRKGHTSPKNTTQWVCLDIDGLPPRHSIDTLLGMLGVGDVDYILQWSASYRIPVTETALRCHVFMLLDKPALPGTLKEWLRGLNLNTPFLRENTAMNPVAVTLHWGLDVTACQNDKLLYIAEPKLIGNIKKPYSKNEPRITLVKKAKRCLTLPATALPQANNTSQHDRIVELCKILGRNPPKPAVYKAFDGENVVMNPEQGLVTSTMESGDYVRLNINGGDSWAYWHHKDNADIIYSFKGEDPVLTEKFDPKYHSEAKKEAKKIAKEKAARINTGIQEATERNAENELVATSLTLLAFQDKTGNYHVGHYDADTKELVLNKKKSEKQVRDFCTENGMYIGEFIPEWNIIFDPQSEKRIDPDKRIVNNYTASNYLTAPMTAKILAPPPTIFALIHHALGSEDEITEHFINWLAFIVQKRERTGTAWVLYGTEGTGKAVVYDHILKPLLGAAQCAKNRVEELSKGFNPFIRNKLLVAFDEVHIGAMKNKEEILGTLRNLITEETISIRNLYHAPEDVHNYANYLLFSNKRDVVQINNTDRRYNVGHYQRKRIDEVFPKYKTNFDAVAKLIKSELQDFAFYMRNFKVNEELVHKPLQSSDRDNLIATTTSAPDRIAEALGLHTANMDTLMFDLPSDEKTVEHAKRELMRDFKQVLVNNILRTLARINSPKRRQDEPNGLMMRDEAYTIFKYCTNDVDTKSSPHSFSQFMRKYHLDPVRVWINDKTVVGLKQNWTDVDKFPEYLKTLGYKEKA